MQVNTRRKTNKSHAKQQKEAKRYVITNIKQKQERNHIGKHTHTYIIKTKINQLLLTKHAR